MTDQRSDPNELKPIAWLVFMPLGSGFDFKVFGTENDALDEQLIQFDGDEDDPIPLCRLDEVQSELARLTTSNATLSSQYLVMAAQYAEVQAENRKLKAQLAALAP